MLERGRFGIEYKPRQRKKDSAAIWPFVFVILAIAATSFIFTKLRRQPDDYAGLAQQHIQAAAQPSSVQAAADTNQPPQTAAAAADGSGVGNGGGEAAARQRQARLPELYAQLAAGSPERPPKVRNLLLRLEEAVKADNIEMAVTTIETLRDLPGEPAADLDDGLARHLGKLNSRWLFAFCNRQWVTETTVRSRDTATRIAAAHGSTLSSLIRLNSLADADSIRPGQVLKVMNHPRFSLTVHRRARYADLNLNGKFFNRYDIVGDGEICPVGVYKTGAKLRDQLTELGLRFSLRDRVELETLIPPAASIVVSET